jgi:hypothetical protein
MVQGHQEPLKPCETYQPLTHADHSNLLGENINTIKEETEVHLDAIKGVRLQADAEKINCMFTARHRNVGQYRNIMIANRSLKNVAKLRNSRIRAKNEDCIHEEAKNRLNVWNAWYYSVRNLLSFPAV